MNIKNVNITVSNFLFIGSYALIGPMLLFFPESSNVEIRNKIIFGMALFSASQFGGVYFLDLVNKRFSTSKNLLNILRIFSICLAPIDAGVAKLFSLLSFGFSQSIFYKISRNSAKEYGKNIFLLLSISTNLCYFIFPFIGSKLLTLAGKWPMVIISLILYLISYLIYPKTPNRNDEIDMSKRNLENDSSIILLDYFRIIGFVLPYSIIMSFITVKVSYLELTPTISSYLLSLNALIVILIQLLGLKQGRYLNFSQKKYDVITAISVVIPFLLISNNIYIFFFVVMVYSILESYQMPNIEKLFFQIRKYDGKQINKLLLIDSFGCFLGPILVEIINISSNNGRI